VTAFRAVLFMLIVSAPYLFVIAPATELTRNPVSTKKKRYKHVRRGEESEVEESENTKANPCCSSPLKKLKIVVKRKAKEYILWENNR